jgi:hypothetical protein
MLVPCDIFLCPSVDRLYHLVRGCSKFPDGLFDNTTYGTCVAIYTCLLAATEQSGIFVRPSFFR